MDPRDDNLEDVHTVAVRRTNRPRPGPGPVRAPEAPPPPDPVRAAVTVKPAPAAKAPQPAAPCPRCGGKLIDPDGLGLCQACGYCRSLEQDRDLVPPPPEEPTAAGAPRRSLFGFVEFCILLGKLPGWFWGLLAGTGVLVGLSFAADALLPHAGLARALCGTGAAVLGLGLVLAAHGSALVRLAPSDDRLGLKDLFLFLRLWVLMARRRPPLCRTLCAAVWGLTLAACGLFVVGGLAYWFRSYEPAKTADHRLRQAAAAVDEGLAARPPKPAAPAVTPANPARPAPDGPHKDDKAPPVAKPDPRPTVQCAVIGYVPATETEPFALVLGTVDEEGTLRFAGLVRQGLTPEAVAALVKKLSGLARPKSPVGTGPARAVWVRPKVFCEVHQSGRDEKGTLRKPKFKGLLK